MTSVTMVIGSYDVTNVVPGPLKSNKADTFPPPTLSILANRRRLYQSNMTDSEEEYIGNSQIQKILLEAASELARKEHHMGRHGGCYVQPCGSASSHNVVSDFADKDDDPFSLRRAVSSPAIPELGRQIFFDPEPTSEAEDTSLPYHCQENRVNLDSYTEKYGLLSTRGRHRWVPHQPRPDQENPERDLSSDGSYEVIDLDTVEEQYKDGTTRQYRDRAPAEKDRLAYYQQYDSDGEELYLEDSPVCSNRPIIRILDEGDDGGETHRSDPGPLGYSHRQQFESTTAEHRVALYEAEKHISYLNQAVYRLKVERDDLVELHNFRTREWMEVKDRLQAEIVELREQNTTLLCDRLNKGGRLNKRLASTLIKAKQESDRALATTLERQQKINELRLLVTMQQRYILSMEDTMGELQSALLQAQTEGNQQQEMQPEQVDKLFELPMRHPADAQVLCGYQEVIDCDRGNYIPGTTTDPELAAVQVFDFPGESELLTERQDIASFDMTKVPYVRGALSMGKSK